MSLSSFLRSPNKADKEILPYVWSRKYFSNSVGGSAEAGRRAFTRAQHFENLVFCTTCNTLHWMVTCREMKSKRLTGKEGNDREGDNREGGGRESSSRKRGGGGISSPDGRTRLLFARESILLWPLPKACILSSLSCLFLVGGILKAVWGVGWGLFRKQQIDVMRRATRPGLES